MEHLIAALRASQNVKDAAKLTDTTQSVMRFLFPDDYRDMAEFLADELKFEVPTAWTLQRVRVKFDVAHMLFKRVFPTACGLHPWVPLPLFSSR